MSERVCLVHYHEIGLKGRNRSAFERRLQSNLDAALVGLPAGRVERIASRQFVRVKDETRALDIAKAIARVPGVAGVSLAYRISQDPAEQERIALQALKEAGPGRSFKVDARRSNTEFSERSLDINVRIGEVLRLGTDLAVDLTHPDITVSVVVTQNSTYISTVRVPGVGGLPVGTASRVISLLSAGIDSPVATWRMMRRGAVCVGVHFSGRPQTSDASERLVAEIGSVLEGTGGLGRVYMVAFGDLQKEISLAVPPDLRVLIYRRLMLKVAERIARIERAKALVTGESLGQVASQTLENIAAVDEVAKLPVLRPLIGNDKVEIIAEARAIGTFELSTQDHTDCCTLFMPRNPETHAKMHAVLDAWAMIDADRMVEDAIAGMSWLDFRCTSYRPPKPWPTPAGMVGYSVARYEEGGFAG
ncbi:MAG TPA: tRNA uracil 4-sulfurtransferase ThiI [Coriobacteriia bacterium]|nr:tRNA uracil 4-sulfurtransferase ThiI [Coriobacteriia bacterium]